MTDPVRQADAQMPIRPALWRRSRRKMARAMRVGGWYVKSRLTGSYSIPLGERTDRRLSLPEPRTVIPPEAADAIVGLADRTVEHVFDVLGCKGVRADRTDPPPRHTAANQARADSVRRRLAEIDPHYRPIDWQCDFASSYRWSHRTFYVNVAYAPHDGVDVKVPWELSRFQHLSALAHAHRHTGSDVYAREYVCQILDWIAANPPMFGVNWRCTMDVAIRAANWAVHFGAIREWVDRQPWCDEFHAVFLNSLHDHLRFIAHNLQWTEEIVANHYLAELAGLVILSSATETVFADSTKQKQFAIAELTKEIQRQVYGDGTDFEASTCYHRLALELFFYATYWIVIGQDDFLGDNHRRVAERVFGRAFVERLYAMFDALVHLLKFDGQMPQIGDNDSGQFVKLYPRSVLDMRYLLAVGAVFFGEGRWKIAEFCERGNDVAEIALLFGSKGMSTWQDLAPTRVVDVSSKGFADSGWYVIRSGRDYCIVSCGPNGTGGRGTHAHCDKLSFELVLDGTTLVVDPGTYAYTSDKPARRTFRSSEVHNAVVLSGQFNPYDDRDPFALKGPGRINVVDFDTQGPMMHLAAQIVTDTNLTIRRDLTLDTERHELHVRDTLPAQLKDQYFFNLTLPSKVTADKISVDTPGSVEQTAGWYSPEYGVKQETVRLIIRGADEFRIGLSPD